MFKPATPEERRIYYNEEWSKKELPDFIVDSIEKRELGFDRDGSGPNDRYNQFNVNELEKFLKLHYPYAAYSSISFYEEPSKREGWLKAELVFDIDAKDLPVRCCNCSEGSVCATCLEDAKELLLLISDTLKEDLDIKNIRYVYSGRGYHIRIFDEELMCLGSVQRAHILDYVSGSKIPEHLEFTKGYPKIFRKRLLKILELSLTSEEKLKGLGIPERRAREIINARRKIANEIEEGNLKTFESILKCRGKAYLEFLERVRQCNAAMLDGKVTLDVKRILRLPSSLHSAVSMKCMEIKNIEKFDPLSEAVPKFVNERK